MKSVIPYLAFAGDCREAMEFYSRCLNLPLSVLTFADAPPNSGMPVDATIEKQVMHSRLTHGDRAVLMASDAPGRELKRGTGFNVSLDCDSTEEAEQVFKALSEGGHVQMPIGETFFAARFGMLTDRYGINWMVNVEKPAHVPTGKVAH